ncbi:MAG: serine hydrolase domain-containing protein [Pseudomonadota bacterium]|jgi:CubicO group peptidase (beta-lactamase class C family)|uniref:Beta-lactamase n=1 Tax=hydrothermal vent metagenome TaxID=652676 RepID=A0A170PMN1_9ZZZZ
MPARFSTRILIVLAALLLPCAPAAHASPSAAAPATDPRIGALLEPWSKADGPGVQVSVMLDGKVVGSFATGGADLEHGIPVTPDSVFHAASLSKQITAFAILLLEQDGLLSIDDPLTRHIPEAAPLGPVTLRQLLNHTSGLRDQYTLMAAAGWRAEDLLTDGQAVAMLIGQRGANFAPGTQYQYINSDYTLLAEIVRRLSGKSLDAFCRERIFLPLGMEHTRFQDDVTAIIPGRAESYRRTRTGYARSPLSYTLTGPTGLATTAGDLGRWARNFETATIGSPRLFRRMEERGVLRDGTVNAYAIGQEYRRWHGLDVWMHGGRDAGFRSFLLRVPGERFSVAVLGNVADLNSARLAFALADIYLADRPGYRVEPAAAPAAPTPRQLASYAGAYELFPGLIFTVSTDGKRLLFAPLGDDKPAALPALSGDRFALDAKADIALEFPAPVKGKTPHLVYRVGMDGFLVAPRIDLKPFAPSGARLADYAGRYWSEELKTAYDLIVKDGRLIARHPRRDDIGLTPYQPDTFSSAEFFFERLVFERGPDGSVTGMLVSGPVAENMRFVRKPNGAPR